MWIYKDNYYAKSLMTKDDYRAGVEDQVWNIGTYDLLKDKEYACGYYIVDGTLHLYDQTFKKDTFIWLSSGHHFTVSSVSAAHLIYIESMVPLKDDSLHYEVFEDDALTWSTPLTDGMTSSKHMIKPEDYGVKIQNCIYTKDFVHEWHTHTAAHGFYVLEGMLQYDFDDGRKGLYGPGEFIASKPGEEILHVQAPHASYCKYLFIGDGPFDFIVNGVDLYHH